MKLDKYDIRILEILQQEGRITKLELSKRIHLSQTPCHERVKRLEKAGYVRSYHADVDVRRIVNFTLVYVTVTLERHKSNDFSRFENHIRTVPEVLQCNALGGGIDYCMTVATRNLPAYQKLMEELLDANIGIAQYFTYVVTKEIKQQSGFPLSLFMDE